MLPCAGQGALAAEIARDARAARSPRGAARRSRHLARRRRRARGVARPRRQLQHAAGRPRHAAARPLQLRAALGHAAVGAALGRSAAGAAASARPPLRRASGGAGRRGGRRGAGRARGRAAAGRGRRGRPAGAPAPELSAATPARVLVTRPAAQADGWVGALRARASLPSAAADRDRAGDRRRPRRGAVRAGQRCRPSRLLVFVSANAVLASSRARPARALPWPAGPRTRGRGPRARDGRRACATPASPRQRIVEPAADARAVRFRSACGRRSAGWPTGAVPACSSCAATAAATGSAEQLATRRRSTRVSAYRRAAPALRPTPSARCSIARSPTRRAALAVQQLRGDRPSRQALAPGAAGAGARAVAAHPRIAGARAAPASAAVAEARRASRRWSPAYNRSDRERRLFAVAARLASRVPPRLDRAAVLAQSIAHRRPNAP